MSIRRILFFGALLLIVWQASRPPPALRGGHPHTPTDLPTLVNNPAAWKALGAQGRTAALAGLDAVLLERYATVREAVRVRRAAAREESTGVMLLFIAAMLLFAIGLLLVPILFWLKYPGRRWPLIKYSLASVLLFFPAGLLLLSPLVLYHGLSGDLAANLDPVLALVDGSFDVARSNAATLLEGGRVPVLQAALEADPTQPWPGPHLDANLKGLRVALDPALVVAQQWLGIARFLPHFLMFCAGLLFLLGVRHAFAVLVTLPTRAAARYPRPLRTALHTLLRTLLRELLIVGALGAVLALLTPIVQVVIRTLARHSVRSALVQVEAAAEHLGQSATPDPNPVIWGLSSMPAFLLLAIAMAGAASVLLLVHTRRIVRARLVAKRPLRSHDGYWRSAPIAALALLGTPVLAAWLSATLAPAVGGIEAMQAGTRLAVLAALPWIAIPLVGWAFALHRDVLYLLRFRVAPVAGPPRPPEMGTNAPVTDTPDTGAPETEVPETEDSDTEDTTPRSGGSSR